MEHDQKRSTVWGEALYRAFARLFSRADTPYGYISDEFRQQGRAVVRSVVQLGATALIGLALGGARAFGGMMPFGCAAICACDRFLPVLTGAACLGALLRGEVLLPTVYALLLFFRLITRMWLGDEGERLRFLAACCGMGMYEVLYLLIDGISVRAVVYAAAAIAASGACTVCFRAIMRPEVRYTPLFETGMFVAVYAAACALAGVRVFGLNLSYMAGFLTTVTLSRLGGSARGCVVGLLWGLGCKGEYAPAFALAGLIAGRTPSALLGVGGGAILCMIYASFTGGYYAVRDFLPDVGIAAALYAPLYQYRILPRKGLFGEESGDAEAVERAVCENAAARATEERLQGMAEALRSLSAIFYGMSDRLRAADGYSAHEDLTEVFAADYASMSELIRGALRAPSVEPDRALGGRVRAALAAAGFRCQSVTVCGTGRKILTARGVTRSSAATDPSAIAIRLSTITGLRFAPPVFTMDEQSISMTAHTLPRYQANFARALAHKQGEQVSGDCVTSFTTDDDLFFCLLCDGMGSGKDAAVAARTCCIFLQKMLEGGNDPGLSLTMLNTFLRGKGYECFATVDLFCVDLNSGDAYFIKGGSAPSYLLRGGSLCKISSASAPVGIIREVRAERISLTVRPGDRVLMASDGVEDADRPLIESLPADTLSGDPDTVCSRLLTLARRRGGNDDASVCVIEIV